MNGRRVLTGGGIAAAAVATTFVFFLNLCNFIYRCGCRCLWNGMAEACNVHIAGVKHCPFCSYGVEGYASVLTLILIPQLLVSWWPARWDWRIRLTAAVLLFPVVTAAAALVLGLASGYWR